MRYFYLTMLLVGVALAQGLSPSAYRQTMSRQEIAEAGILRLTDLLIFAEDWLVNSTDGFSWNVSPAGLNSLQTQALVIMVDGVVIAVAPLGIPLEGMLPVYIAELDSVEFISTPGFYYGEYIDGGLINFHTRKDRDGWIVDGAGAGGNETGDPGPFRSTNYTTPNIERIISDASISAWGNLGDLTIGLGVKYLEHPFTDLQMLTRNSVMADSYAGHNTGWLPYLRLRYITEVHSLSAQVMKSMFSRHFIFFSPLGREIPGDVDLTHTSLRGRYRMSGRSTLVYQGSIDDHVLTESFNILDFNFDWKSRTVRGRIEWEQQHGLGAWQVGISHTSQKVDSGYDLPEANVTSSKMHIAGSWQVRNWQFRSSIQASLNNESANPAISLSVSTQPKNHQRWGINLSHASHAASESNNFWYWYSRGYRPISHELAIDYRDTGNDARSKETLDLFWEYGANSTVEIDGRIMLRKFSGQAIYYQQFQFIDSTAAFSSPIYFDYDQAGYTAAARLTIGHRPGARFEHKLSLYKLGFATDDKAFRRSWDTLTGLRVIYSQTFRPSPAFSIFTQLIHLPEARWNDYADIEGSTVNVSPTAKVSYSSTVRSANVLNVVLRKRLYGGFAYGILKFNNLLDVPFQYHPIGADFALSVTLAVEFRLDMGAAERNKQQ